MTEGLDLKGDLSRWQIISKVPYPSMKDPFILAKKLRDEKWYSWMTALALTQATGRSVRSATDYASTYILDSDFKSFLNRSGGLLPKWWTDAIVWGE
jgi:Rad3-related DNA helicase